MRNRLPRSLWSAALLTVLGSYSLPAAAASVGANDATCAAQPPLVASIGIHLNLLAQSRTCPEHSYVPGPNFDTAVRLWVLVSTSTLAAGLIGALLALGVGLWARRTLRSAADRLRQRVAAPILTRPVTLAPMVVALVPQRGYSSLGYYHPSQRRGPPASFC